jgi:hypothetical protein
LGRLVRSEVDRHPTHRAVDDDCDTYLTVEMIDLGKEGRWLTARIDTQVPHREPIGDGQLVSTLERLLTVVLHNDPLVLRGPESNGWFERQRRAIERHSVTHVGVELYERAALLAGRIETLSGVAIALRREVSAVHLGVRVGAAFQFGSEPALLLRSQFDAQIDGTIYASPEADTSLFASAFVGATHMRFEGLAPLDGPGARGTATSTGLSFAFRGGVEALRTADLRAAAFVELDLPVFVAKDADRGVVHQWVPSAVLGAALLF